MKGEKMVKTMTALQARQKLDKVLEEVFHKGDQIVIKQAGIPMAAMVPVWQVEEWRKKRETFFETIKRIQARNRKIGKKELDPEVIEAIQAMRRKKNRG